MTSLRIVESVKRGGDNWLYVDTAKDLDVAYCEMFEAEEFDSIRMAMSVRYGRCDALNAVD